MTKNKLKSPEARSSSKYMKEINKLRNLCTEYNNLIHIKNIQHKVFAQQNQLFVNSMLEQGKITKADLIAYFKRKN